MQKKVKCSSCKKDKYVNPVALEKRIIKYGSIENIEKKWVCRECLKKGEVKKEIINNNSSKKVSGEINFIRNGEI